MIIAERKPFPEIAEMVGDAEKILVLGCGTCVTVCFAGGAKEVGILSSQLKIRAKSEGKSIEVVEATIERQCEDEFFDVVMDDIADADVVISLACGVGIQAVIELIPDAIVIPGVNTTSFGRVKEAGVFAEYCDGCGNCILGLTGGICPIARCSKHMLNGPCGGSANGMCEVDPSSIPCAWHLIYERLKKIGRLDQIEKLMDMKDWSTATDGGVRSTIREDLRVTKA